MKLFKPLDPALSDANPISGLNTYMSQFLMNSVSVPLSFD